ncbi:MAG: hypothetical protein JXQ73_04800 [Phycisphaerae bacterium]|nr:hypothetical protein [Phycisphaerae bacterium]
MHMIVTRSAPAAEAKEYPAARAMTKPPKNHFFGYYDKCPWDKTGRYLLSMEIDFNDRQPKKGEALTVGMVDLKDDKKYIPLDKTLAWCWQQGTMLQWVGAAPDREIIYNGVDGDRYVSIIRDVHSGKTRTLPLPIYAISSDGTQAVSLDFARTGRLRPGYGYIAVPEKHKDDPAPKDAGAYWMDLKTGEHKLVVSIAEAAANETDDRFKGANHWFNHMQFNPSGTRFLFLHRWKGSQRSWWTRLYTCRPDGSDPRLVADTGMVSHFDWRDDKTILAWARHKNGQNHFYLIDALNGDMTVMGEDVLTSDGHCSYSPDRKWVLNDTYPQGKDRLQTLMLYRPADNKRIDIGKFHLPKKLTGPFRVDLHPRWNRDGTQVCFDSAHEPPTRQVYVVDVGGITKGTS